MLIKKKKKRRANALLYVVYPLLKILSIVSAYDIKTKKTLMVKTPINPCGCLIEDISQKYNEIHAHPIKAAGTVMKHAIKRRTGCLDL